MKTKHLTLRLDPYLLEAFKAECDRRNTSPTVLVRDFVAKWVIRSIKTGLKAKMKYQKKKVK